MILCSCNVISAQEVEAVVIKLLDGDPWAIITPDIVYHAMIKQGQCCGCYPIVIQEIISIATDYHKRKKTPENKILAFVKNLYLEYNLTQEMKNSQKLPM